MHKHKSKRKINKKSIWTKNSKNAHVHNNQKENNNSKIDQKVSLT